MYREKKRLLRSGQDVYTVFSKISYSIMELTSKMYFIFQRLNFQLNIIIQDTTLQIGTIIRDTTLQIGTAAGSVVSALHYTGITDTYPTWDMDVYSHYSLFYFCVSCNDASLVMD